jgi:hypothetical protein
LDQGHIDLERVVTVANFLLLHGLKGSRQPALGQLTADPVLVQVTSAHRVNNSQGKRSSDNRCGTVFPTGTAAVLATTFCQRANRQSGSDPSSTNAVAAVQCNTLNVVQ